MHKNLILLTILAASLSLTACGSSDNNSSDPIETDTDNSEKTDDTAGKIYGPYSTGSVAAPAYVYFDLETMSVVELTETQAAMDTQWDIAFNRSSIYLNTANSTSVYFTGNNADFLNADGTGIAEKFINATPESELADFTAVTSADIPLDSNLFMTDQTNRILDGFYNYDMTTHIVTAADDKYYVVDSDETYSKFRVTDITTSGRNMGSITINYVNQTASDDAFATTESNIVIDAAATCSGFDGIYIDFEIGETVTASDPWDISLPCTETKDAALFELNIAADATAMQDFENTYTAVEAAALPYMDFYANQYTIKAFDENSWYRYGLNGGHILWSQYGVYLIKTDTATYKFQITSYYSSENVSGHYSFRAEAL